uniref:Uncharacterized protein n=1 Tax=Arcella intermedia TaxID=1963864 RepID=A0A6B2LJB0_9EUKA
MITKHQITVERAHKNWIFYAKIHNGKIITCSKTTIKIWDLRSGAFLRQLQGHGGPVNCLDVSDDFVISGSTDKTIKIWGLETGECLSTLDIKREVSCVRYLNDTVICGVDTVIEIWDISQAKCVSVIDVAAPVSCICVVNGVIVSGSTTGDVQLWNIETGKCGQILKHGDKLRSITITEDNTLITVSSDYVLKIWKG